jgi:hypothetical protein
VTSYVPSELDVWSCCQDLLISAFLLTKNNYKSHTGWIIKPEETSRCILYVGEKSYTFRGAYRILVERPEGRLPLGRPRCRWEDNIKTDLKEVGWGMNWIELAEDRDRWRAVVNSVMNLRVP